MQSRRIRKSFRHATGLLPSAQEHGLQFESLLERDHVILRSDDPDVAELHVQPVTIPFKRDGRTTRYTPDSLTIWIPSADRDHPVRPPLLEEVKYSSEMEQRRSHFEPAHAAARIYAAEQGWEFRVITEVQIRSVQLENARIMMRYRRPGNTVEPATSARLLAILHRHGPISICQLLVHAGQAGNHMLLRQVWILLAQHQLSADRTLPLSREMLVKPGCSAGLHQPATLAIG